MFGPSKGHNSFSTSILAALLFAFNEDEAMLAAFYDDSKTIDAKHKPAVVY
ncbi:hypothetical protein IDG63_14415 [Staphylococcus sp. EG-SA-14]|nr:hypothetical protein [Staphylococcus sp. EG-SA-14]